MLLCYCEKSEDSRWLCCAARTNGTTTSVRWLPSLSLSHWLRTTVRSTCICWTLQRQTYCAKGRYCSWCKCHRFHSHHKIVTFYSGQQPNWISKNYFPVHDWYIVSPAHCSESLTTLWQSCALMARDKLYSREKMHNFTTEFLKCAKFHGKFTQGVWEIHGKFTGPTAVILRCCVNAN